MKIGIISINMYSKYLNFACPLHTFAFQQFLLQHGFDSTVINYQPIYFNNFDMKHPYDYYSSNLLKLQAMQNKNEKKIEDYTKRVNEFLKQSELTNSIICSEKNIKDAINKTNKIARGGFGVIAVLIVTQIIAKRMIVPFLSTPLAGIFKNYLDKREAKKEGQTSAPPQTENNISALVQNMPMHQSERAKETFKGFEQFFKK